MSIRKAKQLQDVDDFIIVKFCEATSNLSVDNNASSKLKHHSFNGTTFVLFHSPVHYGTKPGHFETSIIHFPTSEGVSEVSKEQMSERS